MDITLERILSLIPKKPDGNFVHGAKKDFAVEIGFKSGEIVSDWIAGRSQSYKSHLYPIAIKYDVSVEWLKGETNEKKPVPVRHELSEEAKELQYIWDESDADERQALLEMARLIKKRRDKQ